MHLATGIGSGWEMGGYEDPCINATGPDHPNQAGILLRLCTPLRGQNF
jgi:hypothetical protein